MIYIDKAGHLVSNESLEELHKFAQKIGLKREWFQNKRLPHYDCTTSAKRGRALHFGARLVDKRAIIDACYKLNQSADAEKGE